MVALATDTGYDQALAFMHATEKRRFSRERGLEHTREAGTRKGGSQRLPGQTMLNVTEAVEKFSLVRTTTNASGEYHVNSTKDSW